MLHLLVNVGYTLDQSTPWIDAKAVDNSFIFIKSQAALRLATPVESYR